MHMHFQEIGLAELLLDKKRAEELKNRCSNVYLAAPFLRIWQKVHRPWGWWWWVPTRRRRRRRSDGWRLGVLESPLSLCCHACCCCCCGLRWKVATTVWSITVYCLLVRRMDRIDGMARWSLLLPTCSRHKTQKGDSLSILKNADDQNSNEPAS